MNKKNIILIALTVFSLVSCYQITEGDLYEDYKPTVVIEATINNQKPPYFVKVTYSAKPEDSVNYYNIYNAKVSISTCSNKLNYLKKVEDNMYMADNIIGYPDSTYFLNIFIDGKEYKAKDKMPTPAKIYRTEIKYRTQYVPSEGNYIKLYLDKKERNVRYYKLNITKNGVLYDTYNDLILFSDTYSKDTFEYLIPYAFKPSDTVIVDLNVITEDVYKYFYALKKQTTSTFSNIQAPLKNPVENITNQPLGFFQVSALSSLNIVIPDSNVYISSTNK